MPVHLATTSAMSSASTSSWSSRTSRCSSFRCWFSAASRCSSIGDLAVAELGGLLQIAAALRPLGLRLGLRRSPP